MKIIYILPLVVLLSCSSPVSRNLATIGEGRGKNCQKLLQESLEHSVDLPDHIDDKVDVIWFPAANQLLATHTELRIDNVRVNSFFSLNLTDHRILDRVSKRGKFSGFYRYKLRVTKEEYTNLIKHAMKEDGESTFQLCVGGACNILAKNTSLKIYPPFSKSPILNALYLLFMSKMPNSKVVGVEFVGKSQIKALFFSGADFYIESLVWPAVLGYAVIYYVEHGEDKIKIIPIEDQSKPVKRFKNNY